MSTLFALLLNQMFPLRDICQHTRNTKRLTTVFVSVSSVFQVIEKAVADSHRSFNHVYR